ncbi:type II secretion system ATPase GspE [Luteimonas sp. MHLX1A]|uniref:type II secretion system ATPase GspE n=1 Tax=Alterluteimonas muca TaxID=2878684 RepID=UPI0012FDDFB6|nr:type II secretion system ATPase GspE [Luteimonas sp. MHLX1A]
MSEAAPALAYAFARQHGLLLLALGDGPARVGMREGASPAGLVEVRRALDRPLDIQVLSRDDFDRRLSEAYAGNGLVGAEGIGQGDDLDALADDLPATADLLDAQDDAPVIRLINGLIAEAARSGASDVHIEPFESALLVRFRIDGVMREALTLPPRLAPMLVSRVKVMARLDIAERRVPQDGRISLAMGTKALDVRVSTLPARNGERVVMRILDKGAGARPLEALGMPAPVLAALRTALAQPNGIVLVTGPTGSGKTTTLYAGLQALNDGSRNILTVEDPVEYAVDGIGQTQVNARVGMSFAAGLRAILRQDPDVVMIGEIRDPETAQIAVQASLTGHLVMSTVHTNDALGAITRLRDMGIESFLLASTVRLVLAQRLIRRLCPHCRQPRAPDVLSARLMGPDYGGPLFAAAGCPQCQQSGYAGRIGVYEAVNIDERLRALIGAGADEDALAGAAAVSGDWLADSARACVAAGTTTPEEALRVVRQDERSMPA